MNTLEGVRAVSLIKPREAGPPVLAAQPVQARPQQKRYVSLRHRDRQDLLRVGSQVVQRVRDLVLERFYADGFFGDERKPCMTLLRAQLCLVLHECGFSLPMCALAVMQKGSHVTALGSVRRAGVMQDSDPLPEGFNERVRTVGEVRSVIRRTCAAAGLKKVRGIDLQPQPTKAALGAGGGAVGGEV